MSEQEHPANVVQTIGPIADPLYPGGMLYVLGNGTYAAGFAGEPWRPGRFASAMVAMRTHKHNAAQQQALADLYAQLGRTITAGDLQTAGLW